MKEFVTLLTIVHMWVTLPQYSDKNLVVLQYMLFTIYTVIKVFSDLQLRRVSQGKSKELSVHFLLSGSYVRFSEWDGQRVFFFSLIKIFYLFCSVPARCISLWSPDLQGYSCPQVNTNVYLFMYCREKSVNNLVTLQKNIFNYSYVSTFIHVRL